MNTRATAEFIRTLFHYYETPITIGPKLHVHVYNTTPTHTAGVENQLYYTS